LQAQPKTGVGGTVDAFNFIRRIAFPTTPQIVSLLAVIAIGSSLFSLTLAGENAIAALEFAIGVLVAPPIVGGLIGAALLTSDDSVLDFRRLMGMEVMALIPLAIVLPIASIGGVLVGANRVWEDGFLLGQAVAFPLRFLTPIAMSSLNAWRKFGSAFATPLITIVAFLSITPMILPDSYLYSIAFRIYFLFASGIMVSAIGTGLIVRRVEKEGFAGIGHSPMGLFRAFLDHWLRKKPTALEDRLLTLSTMEDIDTRVLSFSGNDGTSKAAMVVSNFHPGPYRDLGSGGLPSEIKKTVERSQEDAVVQVPHAISNHKLNIVSHRDTSKLLDAVKSNYPAEHDCLTASKMMREQVGEAIVSGQAFGRVVLLTITLAPGEMEDLPTEVSVEIDKTAKVLGFQPLTVDAHNSIETQTSITLAQAEQIIEAATIVLNRLNTLPQAAFKVGASQNDLAAFTLKRS